jgi:hypothetical protein
VDGLGQQHDGASGKKRNFLYDHSGIEIINERALRKTLTMAIRQETLAMYFDAHTLILERNKVQECLKFGLTCLQTNVASFHQMGLEHNLSRVSFLMTARVAGRTACDQHCTATRIYLLCYEYGFNCALTLGGYLMSEMLLALSLLPARMLGYQAHIHKWTDTQFSSRDPKCIKTNTTHRYRHWHDRQPIRRPSSDADGVYHFVLSFVSMDIQMDDSTHIAIAEERVITFHYQVRFGPLTPDQ